MDQAEHQMKSIIRQTNVFIPYTKIIYLCASYTSDATHFIYCDAHRWWYQQNLRRSFSVCLWLKDFRGIWNKLECNVFVLMWSTVWLWALDNVWSVIVLFLALWWHNTNEMKITCFHYLSNTWMWWSNRKWFETTFGANGLLLLST